MSTTLIEPICGMPKMNQVWKHSINYFNTWKQRALLWNSTLCTPWLHMLSKNFEIETYWHLNSRTHNCMNAADHAIQIFKNHFIAGWCTTDCNFPLQLWHKLLLQAEQSINMLWKLCCDPTKSANELHDMTNHTLWVLTGTKATIFNPPEISSASRPFTINAWYVRPHLIIIDAMNILFLKQCLLDFRTRKTITNLCKTLDRIALGWGSLCCNWIFEQNTNSTQGGDFANMPHQSIATTQWTHQELQWATTKGGRKTTIEVGNTTTYYIYQPNSFKGGCCTTKNALTPYPTKYFTYNYENISITQDNHSIISTMPQPGRTNMQHNNLDLLHLQQSPRLHLPMPITPHTDIPSNMHT